MEIDLVLKATKSWLLHILTCLSLSKFYYTQLKETTWHFWHSAWKSLWPNLSVCYKPFFIFHVTECNSLVKFRFPHRKYPFYLSFQFCLPHFSSALTYSLLRPINLLSITVVKLMTHILGFNKMEPDYCVAQLVQHPTLGFGSGHYLTVCGFEPCVRLCADSVKPAWDSLSPLSLCPYPPLSLSLSLKLNK